MNDKKENKYKTSKMILLRRQDRFLKINSQFPVLRKRSDIPSERRVNLPRFDLPDFRLYLSNSRSKSRGQYF